jgi:hypothetical protein
MPRIIIEWGFKEDILNIVTFWMLFRVNFSRYQKELHHDASKFRLLRFTVIYILVVGLIGFGVGPFLFMYDPDVLMYMFLLMMVSFIPYFIFLAFFFLFYFLQIIYLTTRSLIYTIRVYIKLKASD